MDEVKKFFTARGIGTSDLAKGLVVHEVLGVAILFSAWGGCYIMRPSTRLMTVLKRKKSTQWEKAQQRINVSPIVSRISRLVPEGKAAAVGLAFGESLFFRKLLVPVLVPLKLWVALQIILLLKSKEEDIVEEKPLS